jgi:hypothetical protein
MYLHVLCVRRRTDLSIRPTRAPLEARRESDRLAPLSLSPRVRDVGDPLRSQPFLNGIRTENGLHYR